MDVAEVVEVAESIGRNSIDGECGGVGDDMAVDDGRGNGYGAGETDGLAADRGLG